MKKKTQGESKSPASGSSAHGVKENAARRGYRYEDLKAEVFKEANQETFLKIRDRAQELLDLTGAFSLGTLITSVETRAGVSSWVQIACVDRLVELGEIRELRLAESRASGQRFFER